MMAVLFAIAWVVAVKTPFGRHVYAVGGNERAARLAGIRVPRSEDRDVCFLRILRGAGRVSSSRRSLRRRIRPQAKASS